MYNSKFVRSEYFLRIPQRHSHPMICLPRERGEEKERISIIGRVDGERWRARLISSFFEALRGETQWRN